MRWPAAAKLTDPLLHVHTSCAAPLTVLWPCTDQDGAPAAVQGQSTWPSAAPARLPASAQAWRSRSAASRCVVSSAACAASCWPWCASACEWQLSRSHTGGATWHRLPWTLPVSMQPGWPSSPCQSQPVAQQISPPQRTTGHPHQPGLLKSMPVLQQRSALCRHLQQCIQPRPVKSRTAGERTWSSLPWTCSMSDRALAALRSCRWAASLPALWALLSSCCARSASLRAVCSAPKHHQRRPTHTGASCACGDRSA